MRKWKLVGLAGIAGVATIAGAAAIRRRRRIAELDPDELRTRLHQRLEASTNGAAVTDPR